MATKQECDCVQSIALAIMDASALEDLGLILKRDDLPNDLKNDLNNNILLASERLKSNLKDFEKTCTLAEGIKTRYDEGKKALLYCLDKLDFKEIDRAGAYINDALQDAITSEKTISCNSDPQREYLPHSLTEAEKSNPELLKKLSSCIEDVEKKSCPESALKPDGKYDYSKCSVNPVAVCRTSIEK